MVSKKKIALGLGLAAAAAGAGYYFYGAKNAATHRKKAQQWARGFKADVLKKATKLKKLDERAIRTIISESAKAYERLRSVDKNDIRAVAEDLKRNWKNIEREVRRIATEDRKFANTIVAGTKKRAQSILRPKNSTVKKA